MTPLIQRWLLAFVFTEIVEVPIYRRFFGSGWLEAFGASAITHPLLWFVFVPWAKPHMTYSRYAALGETLVVIVEALYFRFVFKRKRAFLGSLLANGVSYALGLVAYWLVG